MEFVFGDHALDVDRRELRRGAELIALEPQVFDLLVYLVRNRDRVVSKDGLLEAVWGGRIVSESTLTSRITAVRKAVGDSGEAQRLIRTLPRKGIRFIGAVQEEQRPSLAVEARPVVAADPPRAAPALPDKPLIAVLPFGALRYSFEDCSLDTARRELRRGSALVALQPQVFDVLEYLIRNRERVVSKDDLLAAVWNGRIVSESTLGARINAARIAIGDSGEEQRLIRTVSRKGLRFVAAVREEEDALRKLAAIFAADVAGYSGLIGQDKERAHERFNAHFCELLDPKIREYRGRIVKTTGDGVLAEFVSVVDAVRCATEIQRAMADRDLDLAEERRLRFRIGVDLGEVIADGGDIYGDGVNIAARLEALAAPGSVCVSGTVRDHIGDRLTYAFEDMGEQSLKNIARPVRGYALRPEDVGGLPTASASSVSSSSPPLVAPRLSIVVLPFTNLSDDREQQYFADGITEDLTTDLSRLENMLVISRNTAFTYRNKPVETKQIGRELGVRYVLEGSVRRSGNQLRINAQLIDAATDAHLWTERFDRDTGDLFALQNEITSRLANALGVELIAVEAARPTEHPDALDYILRGRAAWNKSPTRDNYAQAISLFERALALDPRSVDAQSWLASVLATRVISQLTDSAAADIARAEGLIGQVLAASPRSPLAHYAKGRVLRTQGRCEEAIPEYETALALNRNLVGALNGLGWCKLYAGSIGEVVLLQEQAIRLSPRDPRIGWWYFLIGTVHLLQSRTDEAIVWLEKARSAIPAAPVVRAQLAAAYALRGETERAAAELAEARRLGSDDRYSSIARLKAVGNFGVPKIRALFEATCFAGLRKAGVPEE